MLTKDNPFRRREETPFRNPSVPAPAPSAPAAAPAPGAAAEHAAHTPVGAGTVKPVEGSKLIVGPKVKLKGVEISDCDTLVVEGHVESALDSRVIQIAEEGYFNGTAAIDVAEIRGRFNGELTARNNLIVHATGRVSGKIRYGRIKVEEGGQISGEISALGDAETPGTLKR